MKKSRCSPNPIALESGLVGHWKLDESGNVSTAADSAGTNDGTLTNFPADPSANWVAGKLGNALGFDGADDYIDMGNVLNMGTSDWSYAGWFYHTDTDGGYPVAKTGGWDGYGFLIGWQEDALCLHENNSIGYEVAVGTAINFVQSGRWYHFACVHDRDGDLTLYIDGTNEASASIAANQGSSISQSNRNLQIGSRHQTATDSRFDGLVDDIRIYNRALNADEIKILASPCQNPGHMPGTMLYNGDHNVLQYCNGQNWIGIGK